jgi:hypothetical protein
LNSSIRIKSRLRDCSQGESLQVQLCEEDDFIVAQGGTFATLESAAVGFRWGLRFLSLMMFTLGLTVALLLWHAARNLQAPPGAGCT